MICMFTDCLELHTVKKDWNTFYILKISLLSSLILCTKSTDIHSKQILLNKKWKQYYPQFWQKTWRKLLFFSWTISTTKTITKKCWLYITLYGLQSVFSKYFSNHFSLMPTFPYIEVNPYHKASSKAKEKLSKKFGKCHLW